MNEKAGSSGPKPSVVGTSMPMPAMSWLVIPPLQPGERIEDWQPLFTAAVTTLLARPGGEKLALELLPGYVRRRPAEVELVREVTELESLEDAFKLLKTLDDPVDQYEAMQGLCRADWLRGKHIDDFFYQLKCQAKHAKASLDLVCTILIGQLPKQVQCMAKAFYADVKTDGSISDGNARKLITKIMGDMN